MRQTDSNRQHHVRVLGLLDEIVVCGTRGERIAQLATRQRGRAARRQLHAIGIGDGTIRSLVRSHALFRLHHGVYAVGHIAPVVLGAETAALLACGDSSALSHASAAALWGLAAPDQTQAIHVVVGHDRRPSLPHVRVHHTRSLPGAQVRLRHGLPVVSPALALVQIAPTATDRQLELAYDRGLTSRLLAPGHLAALLKPGVKGAGRLRALLHDGDGDKDGGATTITRSEAEERFLALIRAAGLPKPRVNARVQGFELDFFWPQERLIVEIDGYRFHSTHRAFEHDHRKDAALRAAGLPPLRFTWRQLTSDSYAVVVGVTRGLSCR